MALSRELLKQGGYRLLPRNLVEVELDTPVVIEVVTPNGNEANQVAIRVGSGCLSNRLLLARRRVADHSPEPGPEAHGAGGIDHSKVITLVIEKVSIDPVRVIAGLDFAAPALDATCVKELNLDYAGASNDPLVLGEPRELLEKSNQFRVHSILQF